MSGALHFYYRDGCHLCEEMAALLFRGWPDQAERMEWRDVDARTAWRSAYGHRVPVLVRDGAVLCELRPDVERIRQYFGVMANSV